jgi:hypothetical protein
MGALPGIFLQASQKAVHFLLRLLPHAAGIQDKKIRLLFRGRDKAPALKGAVQPPGIAYIHLTAESKYMITHKPPV